MNCFLQLSTEDDFLSLFPRIWIEIYFPLENPIINFSQVIIQLVCRFVFVMCNREQDVSSVNSLALEERQVARSLM